MTFLLKKIYGRTREGFSPPREVRAMLWQYWFTSPEEKRSSGNWWRRELLGIYAPAVERLSDGKIRVAALPGDLPQHE